MSAPKPNLKAIFGKKVRELRLARGLSQEHLGELCGLDRTYISSLERGHRNVSLNNIASLALALGVSLTDLFAGIEIMDEKHS